MANLEQNANLQSLMGEVQGVKMQWESIISALVGALAGGVTGYWTAHVRISKPAPDETGRRTEASLALASLPPGTQAGPQVETFTSADRRRG